MPKAVHVIGSCLLWLAVAVGALWWVSTAFLIYEPQWAVLACLVFLIPLLFAAYVLQRIWTWAWVTANTRKAAARRLPSQQDATRRHPADGDAIDQQWRDRLNSKDK